MEEFGRAGQLAERGLTHLSVRSRAEGRVSQQTDEAETEGGRCLLCHLDNTLAGMLEILVTV